MGGRNNGYGGYLTTAGSFNSLKYPKGVNLDEQRNQIFGGINRFQNSVMDEWETYEFVYMPSGYVMDIHKDNYNLGSRIGILLEGEASLDFFDDDLNPTVSFDYSLPALFDIRVFHNVTNTDPGWRLSFFINFKETYDIKLKELEYLI